MKGVTSLINRQPKIVKLGIETLVHDREAAFADGNSKRGRGAGVRSRGKESGTGGRGREPGAAVSGAFSKLFTREGGAGAGGAILPYVGHLPLISTLKIGADCCQQC